MTMNDDQDPYRNILGPLPPPRPYDPRSAMFSMPTVGAARIFADHMPFPGQVWELEGIYYAVRRYSSDEVWLREHGASLIPPEDDDLHMQFDWLLTGLQRVDSPKE
jgi:hypothetical protein